MRLNEIAGETKRKQNQEKLDMEDNFDEKIESFMMKNYQDNM